MDIKYMWQKMRVLRKGDSQINWNVWKDVDRKEVIRKEIEKLGRPWVEEKQEEREEEKKVKKEDWVKNLNNDCDRFFERRLRGA